MHPSRPPERPIEVRPSTLSDEQRSTLRREGFTEADIAALEREHAETLRDFRAVMELLHMPIDPSNDTSS